MKPVKVKCLKCKTDFTYVLDLNGLGQEEIELTKLLGAENYVAADQLIGRALPCGQLQDPENQKTDLCIIRTAEPHTAYETHVNVTVGASRGFAPKNPKLKKD